MVIIHIHVLYMYKLACCLYEIHYDIPQVNIIFQEKATLDAVNISSSEKKITYHLDLKELVLHKW